MCRSGDEASEASSETFDKFTHLSIHVVPAMPGSLLGLFVEKQMRRFRITVRLYKSELSAGSRSYGAIKKGATSV